MIKLPCEENSVFLITDRLTRKYLIGYDLDEGYLIVGKEYCCFADARYFSMVKPELEKLGVKSVLYNSFSDVENYLKNNGVKKLYLDYDKTTLTEYEQYKKLGLKIEDGSEKLKTARSIKSKEELGFIKRACQIVQSAFYTTIKHVKKGVTENYLKEIIENEMISLGAEGVSFDTIVAFGKNSAVPHHKTGQTVLEDNSVILIDVGCKVNGYCSDLTRTVFFGKPSEKFTTCYQSVLGANQTAIDKISAGELTDVSDGYAREYLKEKGLSEYFTHSLGHGVGLEIHEFPTLSPKKSNKLLNGMVFTIEPGVYFDGAFGIRIEDTVVLLEGKVERLFTDSKDLIII